MKQVSWVDTGDQEDRHRGRARVAARAIRSSGSGSRSCSGSERDASATGGRASSLQKPHRLLVGYGPRPDLRVDTDPYYPPDYPHGGPISPEEVPRAARFSPATEHDPEIRALFRRISDYSLEDSNDGEEEEDSEDGGSYTFSRASKRPREKDGS